MLERLWSRSPLYYYNNNTTTLLILLFRFFAILINHTLLLMENPNKQSIIPKILLKKTIKVLVMFGFKIHPVK